MLLRTSSAPVFSSISKSHFQHADTFKDSLEPPHHVAGSSLSSSNSLVPRSALPGRVSWDVYEICAGDDVSEGAAGRIARSSRLSRAQSEGDLEWFSAAVGVEALEGHGLSGYDAAVERKRRAPRLPSHDAIFLDKTESVLEEIGERDQLPSTGNSNNETILDLKSAHGAVLNDGECYSGIKLSPSGSPLACNDRGCRPLTHSECKQLGFLDMASGVGVGSYECNKQDEGGAFDVSNKREAHYQSLLQHDPENPLLLCNYAQFLIKKGNAKKAEEYFERAIVADPSDGEVLSQYAKLQWDVRGDLDRAETYYEQAVKAAPMDCYVMASYASFLWDVEDKEDANLVTQILPAYTVSPNVSFSPILTSV